MYYKTGMKIVKTNTVSFRKSRIRPSMCKTWRKKTKNIKYTSSASCTVMFPYGLGGSHIFANTTSSHYLLLCIYVVLLLYIHSFANLIAIYMFLFLVFPHCKYTYTNKMQWMFTKSLFPYGLVGSYIFTNASTSHYYYYSHLQISLPIASFYF